MKRALYAGSFDPTTNGHMWVVKEGARLFDELVVVVGQDPHKTRSAVFCSPGTDRNADLARSCAICAICDL